jgi:hypothetical protein
MQAHTRCVVERLYVPTGRDIAIQDNDASLGS